MKKSIILIVSSCMLFTAACGNSENNTTQEQSSSSVIQQSEAKSEETIIYVVDVSTSLKGIDRYSMSDNGDISSQAYVFDNDCVFYDKDNNYLSLEEFAKVINSDYSDNNKMTKCKIIFNDRLVKEVHILI